MTKILKLISGVCLCAVLGFAQYPGAYTTSGYSLINSFFSPIGTWADITISNAGTTGTTINTLTKLTGAPSTAVIAATTDTGGIVGICVGGCGTSGTAVVQTEGMVSCVFSGATVAGHYVQISSATAGDCVDGGATLPTSGQVLGRVLSTNGSAGTYAMALYAPETVGVNTNAVYNLIQTSGSPYTMSALTGMYWNNTASAYSWDLPTPVAGLQICVGNYKAQATAQSLIPGSGVTIYFNGVAGTAGSATGLVSGGAAGDFICVEATDSTTYMVIGAGHGTWTNH
jgi:hypothetical protein